MKRVFIVIILSFFVGFTYAQETEKEPHPFWKKVRFGGSFQLSIRSDFITVGVSPSAIYEFSDTFASGLGLSYSFSKNKLHDIRYNVYGASAIVLYHPIKEVQLSTEFEQQLVTVGGSDNKDSYGLPAWYLGLGYALKKYSAIGIRYDVLYDKDKSIYNSPLTPFVRIYF